MSNLSQLLRKGGGHEYKTALSAIPGHFRVVSPTTNHNRCLVTQILSTQNLIENPANWLSLEQ